MSQERRGRAFWTEGQQQKRLERKGGTWISSLAGGAGALPLRYGNEITQESTSISFPFVP